MLDLWLKCELKPNRYFDTLGATGPNHCFDSRYYHYFNYVGTIVLSDGWSHRFTSSLILFGSRRAFWGTHFPWPPDTLFWEWDYKVGFGKPLKNSKYFLNAIWKILESKLYYKKELGGRQKRILFRILCVLWPNHCFNTTGKRLHSKYKSHSLSGAQRSSTLEEQLTNQMPSFAASDK